MIRLYPLPFRLLSDEKQFKKWQWIDVKVEKATKDHRPESHRVYIDTIRCDLTPLSTARDWAARAEAIAPATVFTDFAALDAAREQRGISMGLLRPSRLLGLRIQPASTTTWSDDEMDKLRQSQGDLFGGAEEDFALKRLRKLPYDFYYEYECDTLSGQKVYRHKIIDWEAGALFWNIFDEHGVDFEDRFREKFDTFMQGRNVTLLMGNIHRFPKQWIIGSVLYPPKPRVSNQLQLL